MRKLTCISLACLLLCAAAMGQNAVKPSNAEVAIAKDGKALLPIFAGSQAEPAKELQSYLSRITGADFAVAPPKEGANGIYVGLAADFPNLKFDNVAQLGAEGFLMISDGQSAYLVGREPLGVQHAVTTALTDMGCRWFFPGKTWEVAPHKPALGVTWNSRQTPSYTTQRHIFIGYGEYPPQAAEMDAWNHFNRMGGPIEVNIGHTWYGLDWDKDFAAHPEWFALIRPKATDTKTAVAAKDAEEAAAGGAAIGQRKHNKPCYSNPEVLQKAIEYALAEAKKSGGKGMVSLTPPDGGGYCECDECLKVCQGAKPEWIEKYMGYFATRPDGKRIAVTSENLFAFVNKVAAVVAKQYPDMTVGCYAYSGYSHPPTFDMLPNVYIQTTTEYRRTPLTLEEQLSQWGGKAKKVDIRAYWSVYQWDWDGPEPGIMKPDVQQQQLSDYLKWHATGLNTEACNNWAPRGLGYYAAAQLLWDVNTDVKALVADFYDKAFGPAARPMERYYVRWYGPGAAVTIPGGAPQKFSPETLKASFQDLDEAAALAKDSPECLARVDALRMYAHYLLLRQHVTAVENSGDKDKILAAVKAETVFGGRLMATNMIHSRPLLGKAFLRRFRNVKAFISVPGMVDGKPGDIPAPFTAEWKKVGVPPTHAELEQLWSQDKTELGLN